MELLGVALDVLGNAFLLFGLLLSPLQQTIIRCPMFALNLWSQAVQHAHDEKSVVLPLVQSHSEQFPRTLAGFGQAVGLYELGQRAQRGRLERGVYQQRRGLGCVGAEPEGGIVVIHHPDNHPRTHPVIYLKIGARRKFHRVRHVVIPVVVPVPGQFSRCPG